MVGLDKVVNLNLFGNPLEIDAEEVTENLKLGLKLFNGKKIDDGQFHGEEVY